MSQLPAHLSAAAPFGDDRFKGVASLVVAGSLSGFAVLFILLAMIFRVPAFTVNVMPYFVSLLVANLLQAIGAMVNVRWITDRAVEPGTLCSFQGGVKQAGNVGTAVWSFILSVCVFRILFLRTTSSAGLRYLTLCVGWLAIVLAVSIGPLAIETKAKGPYFGPTGYWCWITQAYPREQMFLEYFFEFMSSGLSFVLYIFILLRVRGNLVHRSDGWHLRFVPRSERWMLAISRDWLDSSMMRVAARLVWYPVFYGILLVPVAISRFIQFSGTEIPFWATIFTDTLFNLQGLVNAILLITTQRLITDSACLPSFSPPRKVIDMASSEAAGITPFVLPPKESSDEQQSASASARVQTLRRTPSMASTSSAGTIESVTSTDSSAPLNRGAVRR
ncbi:uncharacterized protein PHACADRAFT_253748 [Phanerochaete carnosa HHB-10118-sp]|uniref:Glucose receptor Git3 N-terminal domain-containing protein n=1 Tax=Phanerochaete carnosa (strain HHB-10118-sp) TaxID=650164 RepID=K5VY97_PHACS|nr:uncharacterized protein PHACADRAFT_253748 [Phanerochaete carnosa HHB-10118-sp]EKM56553.1 hypothetical protein PHACADRAFT_253748 [Phanerochaete carnosa HHB-10118-sp]